jgi:hypothetical protein
LHEIGQLDNAVKEFIAKRIVELARDGERDSNKLREHALQTLGFFPAVDVPPKWTSDRDRTPFVSKRKDSSYRSGRSPDWNQKQEPGRARGEAGSGRRLGTVTQHPIDRGLSERGKGLFLRPTGLSSPAYQDWAD